MELDEIPPSRFHPISMDRHDKVNCCIF